MQQRDRDIIDQARKGVRTRDQQVVRMLAVGLPTRTVAAIDGRTHQSIQRVRDKSQPYLQALMHAADAEAVQVAAIMHVIDTTTATRAMLQADSVPKSRRKRARDPALAPWTPEQL